MASYREADQVLDEDTDELLPPEEASAVPAPEAAPAPPSGGRGEGIAPVAGSPEEVGERSSPAAEETPGERPTPAPASGRLVSLDAFRGLTIAGMLLVNNMALGELTPESLTHADWSGGINFADLVFPWFLFIVGVSIPFAAASARRRGVSGWPLAGKVLSRAVTLVLLGWLLDSSVAHQPMIGLGVLQLIGCAYACGTLLALLPAVPRLVTAAALLLGHWAILALVHAPGVPAGTFEEGRNAITHLNETYLAAFGLKGLVSVIPTTAMVLIGTAAGDLFRSSLPQKRRVLVLTTAGLVLGAIGGLWSLSLPFNKPVWTGSYILFTAGCGLLTLAVFYLLVDGLGWRAPAFPFVVFGSNAIVAYVLPILVKIHILQEWTVSRAGKDVPLQAALLKWTASEFGRVNGGWVYTAGYILFWWLVLLVLYRKKLFLRV